MQEANSRNLPRETCVDHVILNTGSDPAQCLVPLVEKITQHVRGTFTRVPSTELEVHEGIDIVNCFSSDLVFAVVVDHPQYLQTIHSTFLEPLVFISEPVNCVWKYFQCFRYFGGPYYCKGLEVPSTSH